MFSKVVSLICFSMIAFSSVAHAQAIADLTLGTYKMTSGDDDLCSDFEIAKRDLKSKTLTVGTDIMPLKNEDIKMQSDLDDNCEFTQNNSRTDDSSSTTLTRVDKEICQGQVRSDSTTIVKIKEKEITVTYKKDNRDLGTCVYKTK
ncbi:hypothetical protein [Bdellovibrio sp. HCB288]|uniref:hypothetical protein n=1 Tax=Bdellovibrio sp. HCB288 TaxID=3394355 RepID=UPI0039B5A206